MTTVKQIRKHNKTYYDKHFKIEQLQKNCLSCGLPFTPQRCTKTTCSDKCRKVLSRKNKVKPQPVNFHYQSDWVIGD